jgi:hypothetical protein
MTEEEVIDWIRAALAAARKPQSFLAPILGVDKSQISRLIGKSRGKRPRSITLTELHKISAALKQPLPGGGDLKATADFGGVAVRGRLAENTWVSDAQAKVVSSHRVGAVFHPSYPLKDQEAYELDADGLPGEPYAAGDFVITVPYGTYRVRPLPGDLLVIRRKANGLTNYTLRRVKFDGDRMILEPVLVASERGEGEFHRLVIGVLRHFV